jgi:hypothetical protein
LNPDSYDIFVCCLQKKTMGPLINEVRILHPNYTEELDNVIFHTLICSLLCKIKATGCVGIPGEAWKKSVTTAEGTAIMSNCLI